MINKYRKSTKAIFKYLIMLGILMQSLATLALADTGASSAFVNTPFSYFGPGFEFIHYSEKLVVAGKKLDMGANFVNPIQSSGGYIPFSPRTGLFLTSAKTLATIASSEEWSADGIGAIQKDDAKFSWSEVDVMVSYHARPGHLVLGGVNYTTFSFNRYNFAPAAGTDAFNTALGTGTLSEWVAAGKDPGTFLGLTPDTRQGAISEDVNAVAAMLGYQYDSFFVKPDAQFRFFGGVKAGVPLYYQVENSSLPGVSFVGTVNSGYDLGANLGMGWNVSKRFSVLGTVDYTYKHRFEIAKGNSMVPENEVQSVQTAIKLNWDF